MRSFGVKLYMTGIGFSTAFQWWYFRRETRRTGGGTWELPHLEPVNREFHTRLGAFGDEIYIIRKGFLRRFQNSLDRNETFKTEKVIVVEIVRSQ